MALQKIFNYIFNKNKTPIELVPWYHSYHYQVAEDVVDYLNKLDSSVVVGLEITPNQLSLIYNELSEKNYEDSNLILEKMAHYYNCDGKPISDSSSFKAAFYIIFTCFKKNIEIVPLENEELFIEVHQKDSGLSSEDSCILVNSYTKPRNLMMFNAIQNYLIKNNKKMVIITGSAHTIEIKQYLQNAKLPFSINVVINYNIYNTFEDKKIMKKLTRLYLKEGNLSKKDDILRVNNKIEKLINRLTLNIREFIK